MVSPTKWTQHFGDLAGLGTAVLALGLVVFGRRALAALRDPAPRGSGVAGLAGATVVCGVGARRAEHVAVRVGLVHADVQHAPAAVVGTVPIATIVLAVGGVVVALLLARSAWQRAGGGTETPRASRAACPRRPRSSPSCSSRCWRCRC